MLTITIVVFYILEPSFLSFYNFKSLLELFPELGIMVIGVTILMIGGEFDLSVGSVFALSPVLVMSFFNLGLGPGIATILSLIACLIIGGINGIIVIKTGIPSFITTLATMMFWRGAVLAITKGSPPPVPDAVSSLSSYLTQWIGPLRLSFFHFIIIGLIAWLLLERSKLGNWIFAVGGEADAARARGINTGRVKLSLFMITSFLAGFAGLIQAVRIGAALPTAGDGWALDAIAASVIGGTSLFGGVGSVIGGTFGAFLTRIIDNGLVLAGAPGYYFRMFIGMTIIGAVLLNLKIKEKSKELRW